jgi:hypothetical protein
MRVSTLLLLLLLAFALSPAHAQSPLPARVIPACHKPDSGSNLIEWTNQLALTIPVKEAKFRRGKVDVDYVRDTIQRKSTSSFMSLWAGPYAFSPDPPKDLVSNSPSFSKRELHGVDGSAFGTETFGVTTDGKHWRHTFLMLKGLDGLEYAVTSQDDATFFDRIIDSLCQLPLAKNLH